VTKLQQDLDAVLAGFQLPWSQGQTEGQINKLKLLKRNMYGRANFDLLKQRMLFSSASYVSRTKMPQSSTLSLRGADVG